MFFTTDGTVKTLGDAAKGIYGISNYSATLDTPENNAFVKAWTAKYNAPPRNFEGETYLGSRSSSRPSRPQTASSRTMLPRRRSQVFDTILGQLTMRIEDHQLPKPNYFGVVEDVGGTLRPVFKMTISATDVAPSVACKLTN